MLIDRLVYPTIKECIAEWEDSHKARLNSYSLSFASLDIYNTLRRKNHELCRIKKKALLKLIDRSIKDVISSAASFSKAARIDTEPAYTSSSYSVRPLDRSQSKVEAEVGGGVVDNVERLMPTEADKACEPAGFSYLQLYGGVSDRGADPPPLPAGWREKQEASKRLVPLSSSHQKPPPTFSVSKGGSAFSPPSLTTFPPSNHPHSCDKNPTLLPPPPPPSFSSRMKKRRGGGEGVWEAPSIPTPLLPQKGEADERREVGGFSHSQLYRERCPSLNSSLQEMYTRMSSSQVEATTNSSLEEVGGSKGGEDAQLGTGKGDGGQEKRRRKLCGVEETHMHDGNAREKGGKSSGRRFSGLSHPEGGGAPGQYSVEAAIQPIPDTRFRDVGGMENVVDDIRQLVIYPLTHPEVYKFLGVQPPKGVLLHGPPGCGKTLFANAIAGETGCTYLKVSGPELVAGVSGESESLLRSLFNTAKLRTPSLIFIDEIDTIAPKRDNSAREMERRIVAQLGSCMDGLDGCEVIVMAATNRIDSLDPMIRRNGRFDREIPLGIPDEPARLQILKAMSRNIRLKEGVDLSLVAQLTPGFVGADLSAVVREASQLCARRLFDRIPCADRPYDDATLNALLAGVDFSDFKLAISKVQPSAKREGFTTIPDVTWEDVGALSSLRKEMEDRIVKPIKQSALYKKLGIDVPAGILLYGPPGCGKTLLAKAVANESGANFISIKGPELLNKYVGESEKAVRQVFERARISAPCVIFFDELDSLCPKRGSEGNTSSERVVNQLLTEMDGMQERRSVYVIAATNRPDIIDSAMLRPGRLDRTLLVPLPSQTGRKDILLALTRKLPLGDVNLDGISKLTKGFSGADLSALLREAALVALDEFTATPSPSNPNTHSEVASPCNVVASPTASLSEHHPLPSQLLSVRTPLNANTHATEEQEAQQTGVCAGSSLTVAAQTAAGDALPLNEAAKEFEKLFISHHHLLKAIERVSPSVDEAQISFYDKIRLGKKEGS